MTILIDLKFDAKDITQHFKTAMPERMFVNWAEEKSRSPDLASVRYAVVWKPDCGLLAKIPDLAVIFSGGAGVDHLFDDPDLPADRPIVRFVDPDLTSRMSEWVVLQCLMHLRQQRAYDTNQRNSRWQELPQPIASEVRVGIMGLGELGQDAAEKLKMMGFQVNGWSRSKKQIEGIQCFSGKDGLDEFLGQSDIVVCLLPLTRDTRSILNADLFDRLPKNGVIKPVVINAGRGGSQVEADIVDALRSGVLGGVSLDVFEIEPLAASSQLWGFDNAILTPHVAAVSSIPALAGYVARQIGNYEKTGKLDNIVDTSRGY